MNINEVCDVNPLGVEALIAAYTPDGKEWLDAVKAYLAANWQYTRDLLREQLPQCPLARLEATYLPWLDVSSLGVTGSRLADMVERECNVKVNSGAMYGDDRYIRLNIACSRSLLDEALTRIIAVIKSRL